MNRGIDHLVLCVRDLDRAGRHYGRLGFTVTPKAVHPFGTGNRLIQLRGSYIELLTVVDPARVPPAAPGAFSFGEHNADFLKTGEGMSMLALASDDARRDRDAFAAAGIDTYPVFDFSRQATLPDGRQATLAFSLAYVTDARLPGLALFACQHHAPEHFWKPDYQRHANGATAIAEVVMVAEEPASLRGLFEGLYGAANVKSGDGTLLVTTARGDISVLDPDAFGRRFPAAPSAAVASPRFAAYRVTVGDLGRVSGLLAENDVPVEPLGGRLYVRDVFEMTIAFGER